MGGSDFWVIFILCVGRNECGGVGRGGDKGKVGVRIGECERNY